MTGQGFAEVAVTQSRIVLEVRVGEQVVVPMRVVDLDTGQNPLQAAVRALRHAGWEPVEEWAQASGGIASTIYRVPVRPTRSS